MKEEQCVRIYYGNGQGKTNAALGQCIRAVSGDEQVIVIQFLKGREQDSMRCLDTFEDNIKVFRFEKFQRFYQDLSEDEKQEERRNLQNGFHYAMKVAEVGECDLLILDEVLGLVDLGIISVEELEKLVQTARQNCQLVMTGTNLPEGLLEYADKVSEIRAVK